VLGLVPGYFFVDGELFWLLCPLDFSYLFRYGFGEFAVPRVAFFLLI
jgi:hypothetical protein